MHTRLSSPCVQSYFPARYFPQFGLCSTKTHGTCDSMADAKLRALVKPRWRNLVLLAEPRSQDVGEGKDYVSEMVWGGVLLGW